MEIRGRWQVVVSAETVWGLAREIIRVIFIFALSPKSNSDAWLLEPITSVIGRSFIPKTGAFANKEYHPNLHLCR